MQGLIEKAATTATNALLCLGSGLFGYLNGFGFAWVVCGNLTWAYLLRLPETLRFMCLFSSTHTAKSGTIAPHTFNHKRTFMPTITVLPHATLCPEGLTINDAPQGETICDVLLENGIEIDHACEKSCACTTCHVVVRQGFDSLIEPSEIEEDLLDQAWGLEAESRLSCQAVVSDANLVVEIPKYTINHAREH